MKDLIEYVARSIVREPDAVVVNEVEGERGTVLELSVAPSDVGLVIGRKGRTIRALRTLLKIASRGDQRVQLEVLEERGSGEDRDGEEE